MYFEIQFSSCRECLVYADAIREIRNEIGIESGFTIETDCETMWISVPYIGMGNDGDKYGKSHIFHIPETVSRFFSGLMIFAKSVRLIYPTP